MLSIKNLYFTYDENPVLFDLSIPIREKELIGLIGPNGAGKTTFLNTISGQFMPDSGSILYRDKDIYQNNFEYKKKIGIVHEEPFLYPYLTVEEFVRFVAAIKGLDDNDAEDQVTGVLLAANIYQQRHKLISNLSKGMRKKTAIAVALLNAPQILFLDEALNGLDFESTYHIKQYLQEFVDKGGTVILSTHVLEVIEKICSRYLVMKDGRIIADLCAVDFKNAGEGDLEDYIMELLAK